MKRRKSDVIRKKLAYLAVLVLLFSCAAAQTPGDREVWNDFLSWYKTYAGPPYPPQAMKAYMEVLSAKGLSEGEIQVRIASLKKTAASSPPELMTVHFNNLYSRHPEVFSQDANALLKRAVSGLKPGKALDCGMGQGRNAVYLATLGWDVTGYDLSDQGLAIARASAEKAGTKIQTVFASHNDFDFGKERWDLIVMTYSFVNMDDAGFHKRIRESLKPGGLVLVEQLNSGGTGPGPANALFRSFQDLRVLHYEDAIDTAEWSLNKARIGRILAQREPAK